MSKEVMRQALEKIATVNAMDYEYQAWAREALAEPDFWEGYVPEPVKPAQQEPVATDWERIARVQDAKLRAMCNESGGFEKLCEVMDRYEHTSPQPAQRTWVGLTDEEKRQIFEREDYQGWLDYINTIEAKLKEKNT